MTRRNRKVRCLCATIVVVSLGAGLGLFAQQGSSEPALNLIGVTGLSWGAWVKPDAKVEDCLPQVRAICATEEYCKVNVFEGAEKATHVDPVPEENRAALKWVIEYRHNQKPRIIVEAAHPDASGEKRRWTFDE